MLGMPTAAARRAPRSERPTDVLATASTAVYDRVYPVPLGEAKAGDGWVGVDELMADPAGIEPLIEAAGRRFRSANRQLLVAQVARETIAALVTHSVDLWGRHRRVFDLSAANVAVRAGEVAVLCGLRAPRLSVLAGDPLADRPDVEVIGAEQMFDRIVDQVIGYPVPAGTVPPGDPGSIAAVAAIIATVRRAVRCGERHLWGTAALAVASSTAHLSHTIGPRADDDRAALLATRPDLARTVELVVVADHTPDCGEITFGLRRTCCLLFKLPDGSQCGTCSLRDHATQRLWLADWQRNERRRLQADQGCDGDGGAPGMSSRTSSA